MSKIIRVHTREAVYVGPTEPERTFPPADTLNFVERVKEWTLEENDRGDVIITHRNPRARHMDVGGKKLETPNGQVWVTRVPAGNVLDVQYEFEAVAPPAAQTKMKGAA